MPPKIRFTNDEIILAAFDLVKEGGWDSFTAIKIAKRLKCSVQPLYREFKSLNEIKREVVKKIIDLSTVYTLKHYSSDIMENIVIGGLMFVWDNPRLQQAVWGLGSEFGDLMTESHQDTFQLLRDDPAYRNVSTNRLSIWYQHAMFYCHGLAALICSGAFQGVPKDEVVLVIKEGIGLLGSITDSETEYNKNIRYRLIVYGEE